MLSAKWEGGKSMLLVLPHPKGGALKKFRPFADWGERKELLLPPPQLVRAVLLLPAPPFQSKICSLPSPLSVLIALERLGWQQENCSCLL